MTQQHQDPHKQDSHDHEGPLPFGDLVEEVSEDGKKVRHRGVYLLPNLFTTGALFCGFYAIVSAMNGNFVQAAIAIFLAMLLDGMDGRVARLTNTQSAFGEQYDSLADMVSFGVAPALVVFSWALHDLGRWGWAAAFIYTACAALRLARFNTQIGVVDKKYFIGLASPAAASIVAAMVWVWHDGKPVDEWAILAALATTLTGLLMVSNFRYTSFKSVDFRGRVPFGFMLFVVLVFALLIIYQQQGLLVLAVIYGLSAPVAWLYQSIFYRKSAAKSSGSTD
ncbi:CDP-diacylglycerol--serine O-phosphatidyltransferase [Cellvibrio japonicus]|nr:CDP-diacylglycerol--serine O-phosphatidyltransferase [Cellvibrio japonicus]QEI11340.1 CDP-diacylglycerol--serine O-phosphatidyltransferase [Cellvibrio japonicus]QEI14914.1 CDP-diacylglycerol--serine O-phosphatidyltransferase [Cellvibrio japonicus]QEI18494.1 CDP-diacylglycerol--serine O-phosphatidyltransferase [Cellvibrio japonicus]